MARTDIDPLIDADTVYAVGEAVKLGYIPTPAELIIDPFMVLTTFALSINQLSLNIPKVANEYDETVLHGKNIFPFWFFYYYKKYPPSKKIIYDNNLEIKGYFYSIEEEVKKTDEYRYEPTGTKTFEDIAEQYWYERVNADRIYELVNSGIYDWYYAYNSNIVKGNTFWIFNVDEVRGIISFTIQPEEYEYVKSRYIERLAAEEAVYLGTATFLIETIPREYIGYIYELPPREELLPDRLTAEEIETKHKSIIIPAFPKLTEKEQWRYNYWTEKGKSEIVITEYDYYMIMNSNLSIMLVNKQLYVKGGTEEQRNMVIILYDRRQTGFNNRENLVNNRDNFEFDFDTLETYEPLPIGTPIYPLPNNWYTIIPHEF